MGARGESVQDALVYLPVARRAGGFAAIGERAWRNIAENIKDLGIEK